MANFKAVPSALTFSKQRVVDNVAAPAGVGQSLPFVFTNNSGLSVTVTGFGFSTTTDGDAVTYPNGQYGNSDFAVVPTGGSFPVTVANGASQSFTVTYAPLRRGSSFQDIRSAILTLFSGTKPLINTSAVLDPVTGEQRQAPIPFTVGVGGGVVAVGFDNTTTHPIMGLPAVFSLADLDTGRHGGQPGNQSTIPLLSAVTVATTGTFQKVNARGVQVLVIFQDISQGCDLDIFANTTGGDWHVGHFTGLTYANVAGLFIGNHEGFDLQGLQLKAQVSNLINTKTISVAVVVTG